MIDLEFDNDYERLTITDVDEDGAVVRVRMSFATWNSIVAEASEKLGHWPAVWDEQIRTSLAWLTKRAPGDGTSVVFSTAPDGALEGRVHLGKSTPQPAPEAPTSPDSSKDVEIENLRTFCSRAESERDLLASQLDMYTSALENLLRTVGDATGIRGDADAVSKSLREASTAARLVGLRPGSTPAEAPANPRPRLFEFVTGDEVDVDRYLSLSIQGETAHFQLKTGYLRVRFASPEQLRDEIERMRRFRDPVRAMEAAVAAELKSMTDAKLAEFVGSGSRTSTPNQPAPPTTSIRLNLNDMATATLTEKNRGLRRTAIIAPRADGVIRCPLWQFANVLGEHLNIGLGNQVIEGNALTVEVPEERA